MTYTFFYLKFYLATSSPPPSPPHRRGNHPPCLAEAAAGPEDVVLILVTAPVLIGRGSSASAVLREGSGSEDPCNSSGNHLFIAFPIHCDNEGKKVIQAFIGQHKCDSLLWRHLAVSLLRTHLLPGLLNSGGSQVAADG